MSNVTPISEARKPRSWNRMRWEWLRDVSADPDVAGWSKAVASVLICQFAHHETARCDPGNEVLAQALGASEHVVRRALKGLEEAGWIMRTDGRGRGNRQTITFQFLVRAKGADSAGFPTAKGADTVGFESDKTGGISPEKVQILQTPPTPPYKAKPNLNQRRAPETGPEPATAACPANRLEEVHPDSPQHETWDTWLAAQGYPGLAQIGRRRGRAENGPWLMSSRSPPDPSRPAAVSVAVKFVDWLIATEGAADG